MKAKGPPQTPRLLVTSCAAVGGTAAVVQAMLRRCFTNLLPITCSKYKHDGQCCIVKKPLGQGKSIGSRNPRVSLQ
jgi:hypothetical protein